MCIFYFGLPGNDCTKDEKTAEEVRSGCNPGTGSRGPGHRFGYDVKAQSTLDGQCCSANLHYDLSMIKVISTEGMRFLELQRLLTYNVIHQAAPLYLCVRGFLQSLMKWPRHGFADDLKMIQI